MAFRFILGALFLGLALAGPLHTGSYGSQEYERHSEKCVFSDRQKMQFQSGKTYEYSYRGKSEVALGKGSSKSPAMVEWSSDVELSWLTPCKVVVRVKNPVAHGQSDHILTQILTEKPMVAIVKDGIVVEVIADAKDNPAGLNVKKGILASIQNVLPELSPLVKGQDFIESDTLGHCPTTYTVQEESNEYTVIKRKDHHKCKHHINEPSQNLMTALLLKFPLSPIRKSESQCTQVIRKSDKIITSVSCKDKNELRTMITSPYTAEQESHLTLKRVEDRAQEAQLTHPRTTDLKFEDVAQPKRQSELPEVEQLLKKICAETKDILHEEASSSVAKLIGHLHRIPEDKFQELIHQIRQKTFCSESKRLESLFLDAIAFVDNAGAVKLMVDEIVSGRVSGGRTALYVAGLHLMTKPCIHTVQALEPIFESKRAASPVCLAAGALVHRYQRNNPHAMSETPVQQVQHILSQKIDSYCSSSANHEKKQYVLTILKTVGNIGNTTAPLRRSVQKCLENQQADEYVRVASAEAYRRVPCKNRPTQQLIDVALKRDDPTEVRIAAYVASVKCVSYEQAERIVSEISKEHNTQVRAFILSHMKNLQESNAPHLSGLSYNLTALYIPTDYPADMRKYSRHHDMSYYSPTAGVGAGVESSIIYAPGSYLPRSFQQNLTANIYDQEINVFEVGARTKNAEKILDIVLRKLQHLDYPQMMNELKSMWNENSSIKQHLHKYTTEHGRRENMKLINRHIQHVIQTYSEVSGPENLDLDMFVRIFGIELISASLSPKAPRVNVEQMIERAVEYIQETLMQTAVSKANSARTAQLNWENFIPTAQGIPLQVKFVVTPVLSANSKNRMNSGDFKTDIQPSLSVDVNVFAGYSFGVKIGQRSRTKLTVNLHSIASVKMENEKVEIVYDVPQSLKVANFHVRNSLIVKMPTKEDKHIQPQRQELIRSKACTTYLRQACGIELCAELARPSYIQHLPLYEILLKVEVKKSRPEKPLSKIVVNGKWRESLKEAIIELEFPGAAQPKKGEFGIEYKSASREQHAIMIFKKSPSGQERALQLDVKGSAAAKSIHAQATVSYGRTRQLSSSDEVLMTRVRASSQERELEGEFIFRTKSHLARYLEADIATDIAVKFSKQYRNVPSSIEVRRCDWKLEVPRWVKAVAYYKKSAQSSQHEREVLFMVRTPSQELVKVQGDVKIVGEILLNNFHQEVNVKAKALSRELDLVYRAINNEKQKQVYYAIKRAQDQKYVFLANIESRKQSASSYAADAELRIPSLTPDYKVEGKVNRRDPRNYDVQMTLKKNHESILSVQGPVTLRLEPQVVKVKTDLRFKSPRFQSQYLLQFKTTLESQKKEISVHMKQDRETVFSVEVERQREDPSSATTTLSVTLPEVVDGKIKSQVTRSSVQLVANGFLKPSTSHSRKVKALASVDLEQKSVTIKIAHDLARNPQKKFELRSTYDYDISRRYVSSKGEVKVDSRPYKYKTELVAGFLSVEPNRKSKLSVQVTNPEGKQMQVEAQYQIEKQSQPRSVEYKLVYKPFHHEKNEIEGKHTYAVIHPLFEFDRSGQVKMNLPSIRVRDVRVQYEAKINFFSRVQKMNIKVDATGPQIRAPVKLDVQFENSESRLEAKSDIELGSSNLRAKGQVQITKGHSRPLEEVHVNYEIQAHKHIKIRAMKKEQAIEFEIEAEGKPLIVVKKSNPSNGQTVIKVVTPSRESEGKISHTQNAYSVEVYPNLRRNQHKYELRAEHHHSPSQLTSKAVVKYPGSEREYGVSSYMSHNEEASRGTIELDIFRSPQEKVQLAVVLRKKTPLSYMIQADAKIPGQNFEPRFEGIFTWSPESKSFEAYAKRSPSEKPEHAVVFKLNRATSKNSALFAMLKSGQEKAEIILAIHKQQNSYCQGFSVNGTMHSKSSGSYDLATAVCGPAYVEFGMKERQKRSMYVTKVGIREYESAEFSVQKVLPQQRVTDVLTMVNTKPTVSLFGRIHMTRQIPAIVQKVEVGIWSIWMESHYNSTGVQEYQHAVIRPLKRGYERLHEVVKAIRELQREYLPKLPRLSEPLKQDMEEIKQELREVVRVYEHYANEAVKYAKEYAQIVQEQYRHIKHRVQEIVKELEHFLKRNAPVSFHEVREYVRSVRERISRHLPYCHSRGLECVREVVQHQVHQIYHSRVVKDAIRYIRESWFEWLLKELEMLLDFFRHYWDIIVEKFKQIWKDIMNLPIVKEIERYIEDIIHHLCPPKDPKMLWKIVGKMAGFYASEEASWVQLVVPVIEPRSIPRMREIMRPLRQPSTILNAAIRPHSQRAELKNAELTTFDGLRMEMIPSNCELMIAEVGAERVTARVPDHKRTHIKIRLESGENIKIELDENKRPKIPMLGQKDQVTIGNARIVKESDEVKVEMKNMEVQLYGNTVEVVSKPWAYSKMTGMMGNSNMEMSDDIHADAEVKYVPHRYAAKHDVSKNSSRRLMEEYRINRSCAIPRA